MLRIYEGSLSLEMLKLGFSLSLISVLGVFVSKFIVKVRRDAQRHEQPHATFARSIGTRPARYAH